MEIRDVLADFVGVDKSEIKKLTRTVLEWGGIYYEVTSHTGMTASYSHYIKYPYKNFRYNFLIRQLGNQSKVLKKALDAQKISE